MAAPWNCLLVSISLHVGPYETRIKEKRIKDSEVYMMQREWAGTTAMTLKSHVDRHWTASISLSEATDHVSHQVPNERTIVGHLLQSITRKYAKVIAAITAIEMDNAGMSKDFKDAVAFIALTWSVAKKQSKKRVQFDSATIAATICGPVIGKTGVEIRYHKRPASLALSQEQRHKLIAHNATVDGGKYKLASKTSGHKRKSNSVGGGG